MSAPKTPAAPHSWPMSVTEREAVSALLAVRAQIDARIEAVWREAAARLSIDPKTGVVVRGGAWVETKSG